MNDSVITGWDIGGAHLKVAECDLTGKLQQVFQIPCPLWYGIDALHTAITDALKQLSPDARTGHAAITMTGELADCFPNRQAGVMAIVDAFSQHFPAEHTRIFAGNQTNKQSRWLMPSECTDNWSHIASRNWQASADYAAQHIENGLFIDLGSTTCDIIPLKHGHAAPQGFNDYQRQISRELLYTGTIRTPLIALANHAPFKGEDVGLAAEVFATTGDCWLLLNELSTDLIQDASADGQPWTRHHAAIRLARLLGTDADDPSDPIWVSLARWFAGTQSQLIIDAIKRVIEQSIHIDTNKIIIGAGIGRFITSDCAKQLDIPYVDFNTLTQSNSTDAADHAPAAAVALLAYSHNLWK